MNIEETKKITLSLIDTFNEAGHVALSLREAGLKKETKSENTWTLDINDINQDSFDLCVVNPHIEEEVLPEPSEILKEIEELEKESSKLLDELKKLI